MGILINVGMIVLIVSYIIEYSGIVLSIKKFIWKLLNGKQVPFQFFQLKPFDCSLCMTFWIVLIYLLFNSYGIIPSLFVAVISSYLSGFVSEVWQLIFNIYKNNIDKLWK